MKKWKIIKCVTSSFLLLWLIHIIVHVPKCINHHYPTEMLGVTVYNWFEYFTAEIYIETIMCGIPLIINLILLIISVKKLKG